MFVYICYRRPRLNWGSAADFVFSNDKNLRFCLALTNVVHLNQTKIVPKLLSLLPSSFPSNLLRSLFSSISLASTASSVRTVNLLLILV